MLLSGRTAVSSNAAYSTKSPFSTLRLVKVSAMLALLTCTGCLRKLGTDVNAYQLDQVSYYAVLAPARPPAADVSDFQTVTVKLNVAGTFADTERQCFVEEPPFSLKPGPIGSRRWLVKSPSVEGWELHAGEYDLKTKWFRFISKLSTLQQLGCFGSADTATITRTIVEGIPFPISESLLFYYSFSGSGFVDLKSGMQLRIEKSLVRVHDGVTAIASLEARYEVVSLSSGKFTLRLSETKNRNLAKEIGDERALIFDLPNVINGRPKLRLFLENLSNSGTKRPPILLAAMDNEQMDKISRKIETSGVEGCTSNLADNVSCTVFQSAGVSLLISCRINGKKEYKAFGTTVSQIINDKDRVLERLTLKRKTTNGHYASVSFPTTIEAARQIILLDGDQLSW